MSLPAHVAITTSDDEDVRIVAETWRQFCQKLQDKFDALYYHCTNLANENEAMEDEIDSMAMQLSSQEKHIVDLDWKLFFLQQEAAVNTVDSSCQTDELDISHCESFKQLQATTKCLTKAAATQANHITNLEVEKRMLQKKTAELTYKDNLWHLKHQEGSFCTLSGALHCGPYTPPTPTIKKETTATVGTMTTTDAKHINGENMSKMVIAKQETFKISRMSNIVDTLAAKYSPINSDLRLVQVSPINSFTEQGSTCHPDRLPTAVPSVLLGIWTFVAEPSDEENKRYDRYLRDSLRHPPVHSPRLPIPHVNWRSLNPNQFKNLPQPSAFPVQGCSLDPDLYLKKEPVYTQGYYRSRLVWEISSNPFGYKYGFNTNMGVVAVPDIPIHGYRCCEGSGNWDIDAKS